MPVQRLGTAEEYRRKLTESKLKEIRKLYEGVYKDVSREIKKKRSNIPRRVLKELERDTEKRIESVNHEIETGVVKSMTSMCESVVSNKKVHMKEQGYKDVNINHAFIHVPDRVVKSIASGSVYNNGWTLSKAIWGYSKATQDEIQSIIARGVASGKDMYSIAKDIEKYVMPERAKRSRIIEFQKYKRDSQGNLIRDGNGDPIPDGVLKKYVPGRVDYNAQRLARTMISHAYQQSFEAVNRNDPFVVGYIWHSSGQHGRTCRICLDRDGEFFQKDELPLDHPNGMCTFEAYMEDDLITIANRIATWYESPEGTFPEIDEYAKYFMS